MMKKLCSNSTKAQEIVKKKRRRAVDCWKKSVYKIYLQPTLYYHILVIVCNIYDGRAGGTITISSST